MFDDFHKIIEDIRQLQDPAKVAAAQTAFIAWCIARVVYYAAAAFVVWALGRRLIQAGLAALREARQMPD